MPNVEPLGPPYNDQTTELLNKMTPTGVAPLQLFRTFVHNLPMTEALTGFGGYALSNELSLSLRDREIAINRTCVRCQCEYEWGVHVAFFAEKAGLTADQITSLTHGEPTDPCWLNDRDRLLIAAVDALHDHADFTGARVAASLDTQLRSRFTVAELLDLTMLCGWYHAISFTANALQVDLESGSPRFADYVPELTETTA